MPHIELDSDSQFYEQLENNVFKNLRAEPPYSVPQIDEKVRSLRVKRYLPPSKKVNIMKTLKLKELWEENKAIRIAFLLVLALAALVMVTITLMGGDDSSKKAKN